MNHGCAQMEENKNRYFCICVHSVYLWLNKSGVLYATE